MICIIILCVSVCIIWFINNVREQTDRMINGMVWFRNEIGAVHRNILLLSLLLLRTMRARRPVHVVLKLNALLPNIYKV